MTEPGSEQAHPHNGKSPRPDYDNPPVVEVALSVQFDRLEGLDTAQVGQLWVERYKDRYPRTEDNPPLDPLVEILPGQDQPGLGIALQFGNVPPLRRTWFLNEGGNRLVQIQSDRFVYNWRKEDETEKYIRYENVLEGFIREYTEFTSFIEQQGIGKLKLNQCEITYVNPLVLPGNINTHQNLDRLLTVFRPEYCPNPVTGEIFLEKPESVRMALMYLMKNDEGKAYGRLHVSADPVINSRDKKAAYMLKLTCRGVLLGSGLEGIKKFFDKSREWIVHGFHCITTEDLHKEWGMKNDNS